jgi:septal ring factor EnvC (AmiA/AmiB activator)
MNAELKEKVKKMIIRLNALIYLEDAIDMSNEVAIVKELTEQIKTIETKFNIVSTSVSKLSYEIKELERDKENLTNLVKSLEHHNSVLEYKLDDLGNRDY